MRVGVVGAGALGLLLTAGLIQAGARVVLVARGPSLDAVNRDGVVVLDGVSRQSLRPEAASAQMEILSECDVVIIATKLYDLAQVAAEIALHIGRGTALVSVQNGVSAPYLLADLVGADRVVAGVSYLGGNLTAPGVVERKSTAGLSVAALAPSAQGAAAALAALSVPGTLGITVTPDIRGEMWRKFALFCGLGAVACLARQPIGVLIGDSALRTQVRAAIAEVVALGRAEQIAFSHDAVDRMVEGCARFAPETRLSTLDDLLMGRRLEVPWLQGYVAARAQALGLDCPINNLAAACLIAQDPGA